MAILHGRGGWHDVPEAPAGLSLTDAMTGHSLWQFVADTGTEPAPTWQALYVMHWDAHFAYWFRMNPEESHLIIDAATGKLLRTQSLVKNVDYRRWNRDKGAYDLLGKVNLRELPLSEGDVIRVQPAWHANIVVDGFHYFLVSSGHRRNRKPPKGRAGPAYCVARVGGVSGVTRSCRRRRKALIRRGAANRVDQRRRGRRGDRGPIADGRMGNTGVLGEPGGDQSQDFFHNFNRDDIRARRAGQGAG